MAKGGKRKGAGRKSKKEEQALAEKINHIEDPAIEALLSGVQAKEQWAVKLFFEYYYGKPEQTKNLNHNTDSINLKELLGFDTAD